jgi:arginine-tRNA-protein transferase
MNRSQKRIWKRNQDIEVTECQPSMTDEYFELYERYINARHADGDMHPPDIRQFESFLVDGRPEALFFEFRKESRLLAVAVADELIDGLSAIYTFFDPDESTRSLGVHAVLHLIDEAKRKGMSHLYLGYWIKECRKMSYKTDYKPLEMFVNNHWLAVDP